MNTLFKNDKAPYEQIHIRACKQILGLSKQSSNFGARAELGRIPLIFNIICSVIKYRIRLEQFDDDDLLFHALESQSTLKKNSYNTLTYSDISERLLQDLGMRIIPKLGIENATKYVINKLAMPLIRACKSRYMDFFKHELDTIRSRDDTKLSLYGVIKTRCRYERYLDLYPSFRHIIKFRLSDHILPVERGRYARPQLPRMLRLCTLCKNGIGDEMHALFICDNSELRSLRDNFLNQITKIYSPLSILDNHNKLTYLLGGCDANINFLFGKWLHGITTVYKSVL